MQTVGDVTAAWLSPGGVYLVCGFVCGVATAGLLLWTCWHWALRGIRTGMGS